MEIKISAQDEFTLSEKEIKEKQQKIKNVDNVSELRQDLVTGDWVVIATGRAKRPEDFSKNVRQLSNDDSNECLFCEPEKTNQEKDVLIYRQDDGDWTLRVFPNKFPAFSSGGEMELLSEGPYFAVSGFGYHEVLVTRDHERHMALLDEVEIAEIFDAYQDRYLSLMKDKNVNYISIFHNHGKEAGASIAHPHSQLMAIPVISPYVKLELEGSKKYFKANNDFVYEVMVEYESQEKKRIVFENDRFIAFCPFSSRAAFEVWVMPKYQQPYFERTNNEDKLKLAEVFKKAMFSICKALNDPAYNFYIHTAPCDGKDYPYYRWHIEILPHTSNWAGFELETGIEISTIEPEKAAEYLRKWL
ncbi:MAG: Galactose-1-phosphate uridylyltransferase [Candidatus Moranbacteria bacterium GW2011_GWE2_35_2-]|nr:MAG: Galactose-1-phosphate uridylyltransferase [Candidatus Moranbacteria bacterium GW2011_GWE2_35_2-]KKQ22905.1 MAG: Galactose-1-phosphate uridylyltransferase [Candidatus Moranbacteria bacterium GW2011_GWF2_37_11]KKQ29263.1 MAG: Galactose-1-phosphate uridylyltransferase [Candidatus Moranbacteria bacterium GW2011_GWD1_37_17]KKQ30864.1 MAG: Galactose-1-phosphate uridylyltransferase [Candidatus Moranbacteria bacterium GW2011_GWE1_37_24]HBO16940.1 galactose-1-phosphate uridylyltransferase [Candi